MYKCVHYQKKVAAKRATLEEKERSKLRLEFKVGLGDEIGIEDVKEVAIRLGHSASAMTVKNVFSFIRSQGICSESDLNRIQSDYEGNVHRHFLESMDKSMMSVDWNHQVQSARTITYQPQNEYERSNKRGKTYNFQNKGEIDHSVASEQKRYSGKTQLERAQKKAATSGSGPEDDGSGGDLMELLSM